MPWLTVTGTGTWGYGRATGRDRINARGESVLDAKGRPQPEVEMVSFPAGVHLVDEETAERARAAGGALFVTETEPVVIKRDPSGPLTWDDIRLPADGGIYIQTDDGIEEMPVDLDNPGYVYPCGVCSRSFPSQGSRDRHYEFHHQEASTPD